MEEPKRKSVAEVFKRELQLADLEIPDKEVDGILNDAYILANAYGLTVEEAAQALARTFIDFTTALTKFISDIFLFTAGNAPPVSQLRRKWEADRAEQARRRFTTKIKHLKLLKSVRRVYSPPP